ncbi:hypothetical protein KUTeg_023796 [Tegillarca granosa]|uniref:Uncharacterized protein n=1 Tax=Tegillarca granosa TaxID=220873 RepID=A0ABQ9E2Q4_TEGGR|nr:hypothetical protein KUTeg_023796 [Tegillarca granosa]
MLDFALKMSRRKQMQLLLNVAKCGNAKTTPSQRNNASVAGAIPLDALDTGVSTQEKNIPFEQMPGPKGFPLLGTIPYHFPGGKFHGLQHNEVTDMCQKEYGTIYKETILPGFTLVHLFDPNDIETVFRADGKYPMREAFHTLAHFNKKFNNNTQGLLTSKKCFDQRLYQLICLNNQLYQMISCQDYISYEIRWCGIAVVCFNKRLGALQNHAPDSEAARFIDAVDIVMDVSQKEFKQLPWYRLFNTPTFKRLAKAQYIIRQLAVKYSQKALEDVQKRLDAGEDVTGEQGDLIPYLMSKTELTEDQVLTVISELILAGVDTTGHHLAFTLYLLALNKDKQDILYKEINENIPHNDQPTENEVSSLSYLKAVLKESHRVLPVAPGNIRKTVKDLVLSGYTIPAGVSVAIHTNWVGKQETYFKDSHKFKPERWLRINGSSTNSHPFAYLPFGFGPRSCIGKRFAEQESTLALIKILKNFHIDYVGEDLKIECSITNTPIIIRKQ